MVFRFKHPSKGSPVSPPALVESTTDGTSEFENRLARRLASGQGDLIYAITLIVLLIAILRALIS